MRIDLNTVDPEDMAPDYFDFRTLKKETWRSLPHPMGHYIVSDQGRVKDFNDRLLIPGVRNDILGDSVAVNMFYNSEVHTWRIWKLLTLVFFTNGQRYLNRVYVDYRDDNPYNVRLDNYIYKRKNSEGLADIRVLNNGEFMFDNRTGGRIIVYDLNTGYEESYFSANEAARVLGLQQPNISACLTGKRRTHKGYSFRYASDK